MEFQPVVLAAGRGSRMTDLTAKIPKALLPVGNMPMLWYPINMLERAGFEEAIVVVLESFSAEAEKLLVEVCEVKIRLDFVTIPDSDYLGTADSLRHIKDKIKTDVILVSCDLITDVSLHHIANLHRTYDASLTMLLSTLPEQYSEIPAPGPKTKKRTEKDFIGFDEKGTRILFMTSEADLEDDSVTFKRSLLKKHPCINIKSHITDCHLYIMKKWVIDYLADNGLISSLKGELIPYLVKKQFSKQRPSKMPRANESVISEDTKADIFSYIHDNPLQSVIQEMSTWIDHMGDMADCFHGNKIRCYGYIQKEGFCVRTNTVSTFCETNKQIHKILPLLAPDKEITGTHSTVQIKGKSQIGSNSLVGEGVSVGDKVSIKGSVIGKHCSVGDKVKITNSVILDHAHIGEGCSIQGSVVCANCHINEKCELKDCIVGSGQNVNANSKFTNEAIVDDEKMMEI